MAFSTAPVTQQTNPLYLPAHEEDFITLIQQHIDAGEFHEAIAELLFKLTNLQSTHQISRFYQLLFELFPHFDQACFVALKERLQELLNYSSDLPENQRELAIKLGSWHIDQGQSLEICLEAMDYFAQAIQIANKKAPHLSHALIYWLLDFS